MSDDFDKRITALEEWRIKLDLERAAEAVDRKHLDKRLDDIQEKISEMIKGNQWLTRTIYGALIAAVFAWIFTRINFGV